MLKTLSTLQAIRSSTAINILIFYIQKLPLISNFISDDLYANRDIKKVLAVIVRIIGVFWKLLLSVSYVGLLIYLPVAGFGESLPKEDQLLHFIHIFFLISFVVSGVSSASVLEPKREKYVAIKLFRLAPAEYMRGSLTFKYTTFFIFTLPAMLFFGSLLGATIVQSILLTAAAAMWRILCEYLHLKLFEKTGKVLIKMTGLVWFIILLGYAAAYLPLLLNRVPKTGELLLSLPVLIVILTLGVIAAIQLVRYSDYRSAVDAATKRDDPLLDLKRMMSEAQKTTVQTKESDYSIEQTQSNKLQSKEGYAYLNALFFARHRSLVRQPLFKRLFIIGAIGAVGVFVTLFFEQQIALLNIGIEILFPFLFVSLYFFSIGEKMCRAMFYHCDLSLLRYSFYRNAAFEHFRIRLMKIMGLNLLIATALGTVLTIVIFAAGWEGSNMDLLFLWVSILSLSIFFSTHHLFLYYIFQPYTTELNTKNPLYHVINMIVSAASGLFLVIPASTQTFAVTFLTMALLLLMIATILVRKKGHITFRVR